MQLTYLGVKMDARVTHHLETAGWLVAAIFAIVFYAAAGATTLFVWGLWRMLGRSNPLSALVIAGGLIALFL
jgi:hypothetical protein